MPNPQPMEQTPWTSPAQAHVDTPFGLVNPTSGLANDYLNVFNEILLVLEFLPTMPEMTEDALAWRPRSYSDYFAHSTIPGAGQALKAYERVEPELRAKFESVLGRLNEMVVGVQRKLAEQSLRPDYPETVVKPCEETAAAMRVGLAYVDRLINEGCGLKPCATKSSKKEGC